MAASKPTSVTFIDSAVLSREVCLPLIEAAEEGTEVDGHLPVMIAVDIEGHNLSYEGRVAVVTVAVSKERVYLFDFADRATAIDMLENGELKRFLEHPKVGKIVYDGRQDSASLWHQYETKLEPLFDLQVPAVRNYCRPGRYDGIKYLIGMQKTFSDKLGLFTRDDNKAKNDGKRHWAPELGGAYERWFDRPMQKEMIAYCAVDVKYFFEAFARLCPTSAHRLDARKTGAQRAARFTSRKVPRNEDGGAVADF